MREKKIKVSFSIPGKTESFNILSSHGIIESEFIFAFKQNLHKTLVVTLKSTVNLDKLTSPRFTSLTSNMENKTVLFNLERWL